MNDKSDDPTDRRVKYSDDFNLGFFRFISILCWVGFANFFLVEVRQLKAVGPADYLSDMWNYVDLFLNFFAAVFLFFMTEALFSHNASIASVITIRTWAAITCFIFWLKCFYWMRVFQSFAHFVTLITRTIEEIKTFSAMLLLIIFGFANFFLILNENSEANPKY